jgi:hypothetical protein
MFFNFEFHFDLISFALSGFLSERKLLQKFQQNGCRFDWSFLKIPLPFRFVSHNFLIKTPKLKE